MPAARADVRLARRSSGAAPWPISMQALPAAPARTMLKKIAVNQLRVGMHLHALEGSWLDHSLWKTRFVVKDPQELARVRGSGAGECWIDAAKGLDGADAAAPGGAAPEQDGAASSAPGGNPTPPKRDLADDPHQ